MTATKTRFKCIHYPINLFIRSYLVYCHTFPLEAYEIIKTKNVHQGSSSLGFPKVSTLTSPIKRHF